MVRGKLSGIETDLLSAQTHPGLRSTRRLPPSALRAEGAGRGTSIRAAAGSGVFALTDTPCDATFQPVQVACQGCFEVRARFRARRAAASRARGAASEGRRTGSPSTLRPGKTARGSSQTSYPRPCAILWAAGAYRAHSGPQHQPHGGELKLLEILSPYRTCYNHI